MRRGAGEGGPSRACGQVLNRRIGTRRATERNDGSAARAGFKRFQAPPFPPSPRPRPLAKASQPLLSPIWVLPRSLPPASPARHPAPLPCSSRVSGPRRCALDTPSAERITFRRAAATSQTAAKNSAPRSWAEESNRRRHGGAGALAGGAKGGGGLRRGAERRRGEAAEGRCEWRCGAVPR